MYVDAWMLTNLNIWYSDRLKYEIVMIVLYFHGQESVDVLSILLLFQPFYVDVFGRKYIFRSRKRQTFYVNNCKNSKEHVQHWPISIDDHVL